MSEANEMQQKHLQNVRIPHPSSVWKITRSNMLNDAKTVPHMEDEKFTIEQAIARVALMPQTKMFIEGRTWR
jgi:hypothetical protein